MAGGDGISDDHGSLIDLTRIEAEVGRLARDPSATVDVSDLVHDRASHANLVVGSVLAWWILATSRPAGGWTVVLPDRGSAPLRYLGRTGLMAAAASRGVTLRYPGGELFEKSHLLADPSQHQARLPGVDWEVLDQLDADQLRVIPDLADTQRRLPIRSSSGLFFPWLRRLELATPALSYGGYQRFLSDADTVLSELIDNVHRWSAARNAFAVVSVTRGGAVESWNRLHVVVADDGIGIPSALRKDLSALAAVYDAGEAPSVDSLTDEELLRTLIFKAFGQRQLPNHNGHGLNATQIRAGQWIGAFDVLTIATGGEILRAGTRGLSPDDWETDEVPPDLPGAQGTLVHVMLQATDRSATRKQAAAQESLPFAVHDYDEVATILYSPLSASV